MNDDRDRTAWAARFGWIAGSILGTIAGFALAFALERYLTSRHVSSAAVTATKSTSIFVPALFVAGALAGHAFGSRGGARRYRLLAMSTGVLVAVIGWALLVLTR